MVYLWVNNIVRLIMSDNSDDAVFSQPFSPHHLDPYDSEGLITLYDKPFNGTIIGKLSQTGQFINIDDNVFFPITGFLYDINNEPYEFNNGIWDNGSKGVGDGSYGADGYNSDDDSSYSSSSASVASTSSSIITTEISKCLEDDEDTVAEELSTGITQMPAATNPQLISKISNVIGQCARFFNTDPKNIANSPDFSIVLTKKTLASELIDFTFTMCFYESKNVEDILKQNNRFGILKFASANGIPITGQIGTINMNGQTNKIWFSLKELEWMIDQGASTKNSTRLMRFDALFKCATMGGEYVNTLFETIYDTLCTKGEHIKICAIGGNVLRAFFLALKWARNVINRVENKTPCDAFDHLDERGINDIGQFARLLEHLDKLCEKSSDADFSGYKIISEEQKSKYGPTIERALYTLCLPIGHADRRECGGNIAFPLIRMKIKVFENGKYYTDRFGHIRDNRATMNAANKYFPEIKWFVQMIPDADVSLLDKLKTEKYGNGNPELEQIYQEIRILYFTLQEVKKRNAFLTSLNSDIISMGNYYDLVLFTRECCKIFSITIDAKLEKKDKLQDIESVIKKITYYATEAMVLILESHVTRPVIDKVLTTVCNPKFLLNKEILIATNIDGLPLSVNSTCVAVGSVVPGAAEIHKLVSLNGRQWLLGIPDGDQRKQNIHISVNALSFPDPSGSIEDVKEIDHPVASHIESPIFSAAALPNGGGGGGGRFSAALPNGGGGGGWNSLTPMQTKYTKESLEKMTFTQLREIQTKIGATGPRGGASKTMGHAISSILAKQGETGTLSGGSKTRKHRHRKTRKHGIKKQRRTRRF